jgi:hypothetical protein
VIGQKRRRAAAGQCDRSAPVRNLELDSFEAIDVKVIGWKEVR